MVKKFYQDIVNKDYWWDMGFDSSASLYWYYLSQNLFC